MIDIGDLGTLAGLSVVSFNGEVQSLHGISETSGLGGGLDVGLHVLPVVDGVLGCQFGCLLLNEGGHRHIVDLGQADQFIDVGLVLVSLPGRYRLEGNVHLVCDLLLCEAALFAEMSEVCADGHVGAPLWVVVVSRQCGLR